MEMADYWLLRKEMVPKLFEVLVPRYQNRIGPYTLVHKLPVVYPGSGKKKIVMELKENGLTPIKTQYSSVDTFNSLTNILLRGLRAEHTVKRPKPQQQAPAALSQE
jgi:hypothetical protein